MPSKTALQWTSLNSVCQLVIYIYDMSWASSSWSFLTIWNAWNLNVHGCCAHTHWLRLLPAGSPTGFFKQPVCTATAKLNSLAEVQQRGKSNRFPTLLCDYMWHEQITHGYFFFKSSDMKSTARKTKPIILEACENFYSTGISVWCKAIFHPSAMPIRIFSNQTHFKPQSADYYLHMNHQHIKQPLASSAVHWCSGSKANNWSW